VILSRLPERDYPEVKRAHADVVSAYPLINAVVSGVQRGHVYADGTRATLWVSTKSGFGLAAARDDAAAFGGDLFAFLRANPDVPDYLHIYGPPPALLAHVAAHTDRYRTRRRAQFRRDAPTREPTHDDLLPPRWRIARLQDVGFAALEGAFRLDLGRRYWDTREQFMRCAIGACLLDGDGAPVAVCYSACIADGVAEVDVLVLPEYRGRRLARVVSAHFFNLALAAGLVPHWDTFASNAASHALAVNFGLRPVREYDLLSVVVR
jgi:hypothetical protein